MQSTLLMKRNEKRTTVSQTHPHRAEFEPMPFTALEDDDAEPENQTEVMKHLQRSKPLVAKVV
jgi:hypothetical protein